MGTCKDCKWWSGPSGRWLWSERYVDGVKTLVNTGHREQWGDCRVISEVQTEIDVCGYHCDESFLTTAPDFGCVHFRKKAK